MLRSESVAGCQGAFCNEVVESSNPRHNDPGYLRIIIGSEQEPEWISCLDPSAEVSPTAEMSMNVSPRVAEAASAVASLGVVYSLTNA